MKKITLSKNKSVSAGLKNMLIQMEKVNYNFHQNQWFIRILLDEELQFFSTII